MTGLDARAARRRSRSTDMLGAIVASVLASRAAGDRHGADPRLRAARRGRGVLAVLPAAAGAAAACASCSRAWASRHDAVDEIVGAHGRDRGVVGAAATCCVSIGLGSCIGLALVDQRRGVAGLAHVMLPEANAARRAGRQVRRPRGAGAARRGRPRSARRAPRLRGRARRRRADVRAAARAAASTSAPATRPRCARAARRGAHPGASRRRPAGPRAHGPRAVPAARSLSKEAGGAEIEMDWHAPEVTRMSQFLTPSRSPRSSRPRKQGDLQDEAPAAAQRRAPRLRTIDFARPTKFTRRPGAAARAARSTPSADRVDAPVGRAARPDRARGHRLDAAHVVDRAVRSCRRTRSAPCSRSTRSTRQMLLSAELPFVLLRARGAARRRARARAEGPQADRDRLGARRAACSARCSAQLSSIWRTSPRSSSPLGALEGTTENAAGRAVQRADAVADGRGAHRADLLDAVAARPLLRDRPGLGRVLAARRRRPGERRRRDAARRSTPRCAASRSRCAPRSSDTHMTVERGARAQARRRRAPRRPGRATASRSSPTRSPSTAPAPGAAARSAPSRSSAPWRTHR